MGAGASAGLPERLDRAAVERLAPSPECFDARAFDIRADVDGCVPREAVSEAAAVAYAQREIGRLRRNFSTSAPPPRALLSLDSAPKFSSSARLTLGALSPSAPAASVLATAGRTADAADALTSAVATARLSPRRDAEHFRAAQRADLAFAVERFKAAPCGPPDGALAALAAAEALGPLPAAPADARRSAMQLLAGAAAARLQQPPSAHVRPAAAAVELLARAEALGPLPPNSPSR